MEILQICFPSLERIAMYGQGMHSTAERRIGCITVDSNNRESPVSLYPSTPDRKPCLPVFLQPRKKISFPVSLHPRKRKSCHPVSLHPRQKALSPRIHPPQILFPCIPPPQTEIPLTLFPSTQDDVTWISIIQI